MMEIKRVLEELKRKEYRRLDDLIDDVVNFISLLKLKQKKYRVTHFPDKYTIRYYIQQGLVSKPFERGKFSYLHFLQIIAIKILQTQYIQLNKIKEIIGELNEKELEKLILRQGEMIDITNPSFVREPEMRYFHLEDVPCIEKVDEKERIRKKISEEWVRIPIKDGIELNVRRDVVPKNVKKEKFLKKLSLRIYMILKKIFKEK